MISKNEIRKEILAKRSMVSLDEWKIKSDYLENLFINHSVFDESYCVLLYSDYHGEVGTELIINTSLKSGKRVYLPKSYIKDGESLMNFYLIESIKDLKPGFKGIKEPLENINNRFCYEKEENNNILMLVPGVAFDKTGFRIGYGKGFYDNYLQDKKNIIKIGFCFDFQFVEKIPAEIHDVKMNYIFSDNGILKIEQ